MISINVTKSGQKNIFSLSETDANGKIIRQKESVVHVVETLSDGRNFYVVYDSKGNSIQTVNTYINNTMVKKGRSSNTRRKCATVLGKFFCFLELLDLTPDNLTQTDVNRLVAFLQGTGKTQCSNTTVNSYLGIIREYFEATGYTCKALFAQHPVSVAPEAGFGIPQTVFVFDSNLPVDSRRKEEVPKYISMDQYISLTEITRKHKDLNGMMLMHLMFRYGMRIGECLGLTEEDFVYMRIGKVDVPTLIVRNRLSDAPYQHAKRKLTPKQKSDYEGQPYIIQWRDEDYSHYYLTEDGDFVEAFKKFMADTRKRCEEGFTENYKSCEADVVYESTFKEKGLDKNHYIFVNRLGRRLSAQLWGNHLKQYFIEAGISVDKGKKENNLSHRFRHGFAMMHARFMNPPVPMQELQKMMHHKYISSTMIYYNPTQEDEYELKTKMQNRFFDNNPKLNAITTEFLSDVTDHGGNA